MSTNRCGQGLDAGGGINASLSGGSPRSSLSAARASPLRDPRHPVRVARPLRPAYGLGDGAKPPENRQNLPVAALHQLCQGGAGMNESEKQFSLTRAASSTSGRAENQIPIS